MTFEIYTEPGEEYTQARAVPDGTKEADDEFVVFRKTDMEETEAVDLVILFYELRNNPELLREVIERSKEK